MHDGAYQPVSVQIGCVNKAGGWQGSHHIPRRKVGREMLTYYSYPQTTGLWAVDTGRGTRTGLEHGP